MSMRGEGCWEGAVIMKFTECKDVDDVTDTVVALKRSVLCCFPSANGDRLNYAAHSVAFAAEIFQLLRSS